MQPLFHTLSTADLLDAAATKLRETQKELFVPQNLQGYLSPVGYY